MDKSWLWRKIAERAAATVLAVFTLVIVAGYIYPASHGAGTEIKAAFAETGGIYLVYPGAAEVTSQPAQEFYGLSFEYPYGFNIIDKTFDGGEILYHSDFINQKNPSLHGFVEVWKLGVPLKEFLEMSKNTSSLSFVEFTSEPITVDGAQGYKWEYLVKTSQNKLLKGIEVFLDKNGKMYRISYFVPEEDWNTQQKEVFDRLLASVKIT